MASRSLEFHPEAEREYLTARSWYGERSPIAGAKLEIAFERALSKISDSPERWPVAIEGFRKFTLPLQHFLSSRFHENLCGGRCSWTAKAELLERADAVKNSRGGRLVG